MINSRRRRVRRPWMPGCLTAHDEFRNGDVRRLCYIVIDELLGGVAGLTIWSWPAADGAGRLRFDAPDDALEVAVHASRLRAEVYERGGIEREPRVGDVFAAHVPPDARLRLVAEPDMAWTGPLVDLLGAVVYDISLEARKVAKLAHFSAHAPIVDPGQARQMGMLELEATEAAIALAPVINLGSP